MSDIFTLKYGPKQLVFGYLTPQAGKKAVAGDVTMYMKLRQLNREYNKKYKDPCAEAIGALLSDNSESSSEQFDNMIAEFGYYWADQYWEDDYSYEERPTKEQKQQELRKQIIKQYKAEQLVDDYGDYDDESDDYGDNTICVCDELECVCLQ